MISSRLFNSLVAAVGGLAGAAFSEGSLFMKRKGKCCVVGLYRRDLGWDSPQSTKQEKCRWKLPGRTERRQHFRFASFRPNVAGIVTRKASETGYASVPEK
jgi:hypothetical protein